MTKKDLPGIRNITISGRIGSGQTTLATQLAEFLGWNLLEGGALFEKIHQELNLDEKSVTSRPDNFDIQYEDHIKNLLRTTSHNVIQSHLAGFDAQGIEGVFKILVVCEDEFGDKPEIRIDRVVNRRGVSVGEAKDEVLKREEGNLQKWRHLYANDDSEWVYWDLKYYDVVVNSYKHNRDEALQVALEALGIQA
jgi:cytidylate kinase